MFERAVLSLRHPFIIRLLQTFQSSKCLYLLTEFIPGGELFSLLANMDRIPVSHSRFYGACVLEALVCLHQRDIAYRDMKPENLLIDAQGYIRMADFG